MVGGLRLAEVVALDELAAGADEEVALAGGLDALAETCDAELVDHVDEVGHNLAAAAVFGQVGHEDHIHLDQIEGHALQEGEGGVARAEVVHPDLVAQGLQLFCGVHDDVHILGKCALRDLDSDAVRGDARLLHAGVDLMDKIQFVKIIAGEIDRDRRGGKIHDALRLGHFHVAKDAGEDAQVDLVRLARGLKLRDEFSRRKEAERWVGQAGKSLHADDLAGFGDHDGLIVGAQPALADRAVQVLDQVLRVLAPLDKLRVEALEENVLSADAVARLLSLVACPDDALFTCIDSTADADADIFPDRRGSFSGNVLRPALGFIFITHDHKMVSRHVPDDSVGKCLRQDLCRRPEEFVARRVAVLAVEGLKMLNVHIEEDRNEIVIHFV